MKTHSVKRHLTRVALLGALTIAAALALTNTAQAAPAHRNAPAWNNNARYQAPRYNPAPRYDQYRNDGRFDDRRYDTYRNNSYRYDSRRDYDRNRRNDTNDTGKIIGAGIVGAILGAVLSH